MSTKPDTSPAEKLLDVIRRSSTPADGRSSPAPRPYIKGKGLGFSFGGKARGPRDVSVGVEVGEREVRMVKLIRGGAKPKSVELKTVAVPEPGPDAPELSLVLRLALKSFLGKAEADIWAMVAPQAAELHFLHVPKVGKKQLSNAIFWTAKKQGAFEEADVVFDYQVLGEVVEKGQSRLSVLAYTATRAEFERLRNLFAQAGYPLSGLTLPSVAASNLFRTGWVEDTGETHACLHLGEEFSRLEIVSGHALSHVRVLKGGLAGMAQALSEASREMAAQAAQAAARLKGDTGAKSPFFASDIPVEIESMAAPAATDSLPAPAGGLDAEQARAVLDSMAPGGESLGQDGAALTPEEVLGMVKPAWERLVRQMEMTFKHYTITLGNEQVTTLYVAGAHGASEGLRRFLADQLGMECLPLDPLAPDNLARLGVVAPQTDQGPRLKAALPLGLTGADRETYNFLYTYKEKEEQARVAGLNRMVIGCWLGLAALCLGLYGWQHAKAYSKRAELAGLQARLEEFRPRVDMPLLLSSSARVRQVVDNLRRFTGRNYAQAVLRDVCELTPENVKLSNILMDMGAPGEQPPPPKEEAAPQAKPPQQTPRPGVNTLSLEGVVKGDNQLLESILSAYLVRLKTSPLFSDITVSKRSLEVTADGEDVLRFTLSCAIKR